MRAVHRYLLFPWALTGDGDISCSGITRRSSRLLMSHHLGQTLTIVWNRCQSLRIVRILSYSRSDQSGNSRVGAPVSHRQLRDSTCSIFTLTSHCLHSSTRLSLIASSSTTGARYPRTNHTLSRLHSPPPFLFPLRLLTLLLYLGQQRSTPSRSRTALVRLLYIR